LVQVEDEKWVEESLPHKTEEIIELEIEGYLFIHDPTILAEFPDEKLEN
jgi:hypothetical protein